MFRERAEISLFVSLDPLPGRIGCSRAATKDNKFLPTLQGVIVKLREWEITQHITHLLGEEADSFGKLRLWIVRVGFVLYQECESIRIGVSGVIGNKFEPDLNKITRESIILADRMLSASIDDDGFADPLIVEKLFS